MDNRNLNRTDAWTDLMNAVEMAWPIDRYCDVGVVVGCSGGADSVTLLRCLAEQLSAEKSNGGAKGFLVAAHFNHQLRGEASDRDEALVRELAETLGIRFQMGRGDGFRRDEETARNQRREFFLDVLRQTGARYLALAHSSDDNVETVLHRLMRGTGPMGLTGIANFRPLSDAPHSDDFVVSRPLLSVSREMIREAAASHHIQWREDESNQQNDYQRNWIRNELIPLMQSRYPGVSQAIGRAVNGQRQWKDTIALLTSHWLDGNLVSRTTLTITLRRAGHLAGATPDEPWKSALDSRAVMTEALRTLWMQSDWPLAQMGQWQWQRLCDLICGVGPASITLPGTVTAIRDDHVIRINRPTT